MSQTHTEKTAPKKNMNYQRDKDREMVKGIFRFYEVPGGCMSFVVKLHKLDPVERFDLIDGQVYTIPLGVAKHLNKNGHYPEYEYLKNEPGVQNIAGAGMRIGKKIHRFGFQSLEFVDVDDLPTHTSPILTVEYTNEKMS